MGTILKIAIAAIVLIGGAQFFFGFIDKTITTNPNVQSNWQTSVPMEQADVRPIEKSRYWDWVPPQVRDWGRRAWAWVDDARVRWAAH